MGRRFVLRIAGAEGGVLSNLLNLFVEDAGFDNGDFGNLFCWTGLVKEGLA